MYSKSLEDRKEAFNNYVMSADEEIEAFEFQGYKVYETKEEALNIIETLINDYNGRARSWNYSMIEKSRAMKELGVFFARFKEEEVFDPDADYEPMQSMDELLANARIDAETFFKQYQKGIMQGRYDSIMLLSRPFNKSHLQRHSPRPAVKETVENATKSNIETQPKAVKEKEHKPKALKKVESAPQTKTVKKTKTAKQTQLAVPRSAVSKVRPLIDSYNQKAAKWGYDLLIFDPENKTISGKFKPKSNSSGFMSGLKEGWRNGDLEEEWKKILKLCGQ